MERRWGNRLVLNARVRVTRDRLVLGFACLHEVSLSGAFLKTPWELPVFTRVCVHLPDPTNGTPARLEAYVVRQDAGGVGLEWCDFAPTSVTTLIEASKRMPARHRAHARGMTSNR